MAEIRTAMKMDTASQETARQSGDVVALLEQELGTIVAPPASADIQEQLAREGAVMRARLQQAQQQRSQDVNSLKESLYTALAATRAQLQESRQQVRDLQATLDTETLLRSDAERARDQAQRSAVSSQAEVTRLKAEHLNTSQQPQSSSLEASSALGQMNQAILERDAAL